MCDAAKRRSVSMGCNAETGAVGAGWCAEERAAKGSGGAPPLPRKGRTLSPCSGGVCPLATDTARWNG